MLREAGVPEVVESRQSLRPWGSWTLLLRGVGFQVKVLEIKPGARLSLQSHAKRSEHWIIVDGTARVSRDGEDLDLHHNESVYILPGCKHRLENIGKTPLKVIEVALGDVDENDITRYQDDWVRY
jgi:mannose-6-phosphate isomerase-like protein (cupin superfamily)